MKKKISHFPGTASAFALLLSFWILSILLLSGCSSGNASATKETAVASSMNTGAAADMEMTDSGVGSSGYVPEKADPQRGSSAGNRCL